MKTFKKKVIIIWKNITDFNQNCKKNIFFYLGEKYEVDFIAGKK